jgi:hypothetical protein
MSLREAFQKAAQKALQAVGDIPASTNYLSYATTTYDASAGTPTTTFTTVAGVKVVFSNFSVREIDGKDVRPKDKKAMLAALDVSGVTPGPNDRIVEDVSVVWEVMDLMPGDAAGALYKLQVRQP